MNYYDVFFIDHMMPDMDGIETLQELRKLPGLADKPCVALTANAISGAREMYLEAGFSDYLSKPVDGAKLEELLMACLPKEKLRDPAQTAAPLRGHGRKATILIVDDDPLVCKLAGDILGKRYRVEACHSGADAARVAEELRSNLILLDINLGDRSGFDVLQTLRRSPVTGEIPVIFLTGEQDEGAEIEGFRSGAADYVRKPFIPEVLLQRTKRIIELDQLQHDLQGEVKHQTRRAGRLTKEMMLAQFLHLVSVRRRRITSCVFSHARNTGQGPLQTVSPCSHPLRGNRGGKSPTMARQERRNTDLYKWAFRGKLQVRKAGVCHDVSVSAN